MDAALRAYHCRKVVNNPFVAGHCYFEAQALSNFLTNGLGDKKKAQRWCAHYIQLFMVARRRHFGLFAPGLVNLNEENARSTRSHLR